MSADIEPVVPLSAHMVVPLRGPVERTASIILAVAGALLTLGAALLSF